MSARLQFGGSAAGGTDDATQEDVHLGHRFCAGNTRLVPAKLPARRLLNGDTEATSAARKQARNSRSKTRK